LATYEIFKRSHRYLPAITLITSCFGSGRQGILEKALIIYFKGNDVPFNNKKIALQVPAKPLKVYY
jgi:hypothetical protein